MEGKFVQKGSVVRITLHNFMVYKRQTIYPGPNFNVTVGPNGSGKSSIVTALSLCLGGEITSLNRQDSLESVINSNVGATKASVEIELFTPKKGEKANNKIIKTTIRKDKEGAVQSWKVNGKKVSRSELLSITEQLHILPGNICQFLPQDVVRTFPEKTHHEIFLNTIKSIGKSDLQETNKRLKTLQTEIESVSRDEADKWKEVEVLEKKEAMFLQQKSNLERKSNLETQIQVVEFCMAWRKFHNLQGLVKKLKMSKNGKDDIVKTLGVELETVLDSLRTYVDQKESLENDEERLVSEFTQLMNQVEEKGEILSGLEDIIDRNCSQVQELSVEEESRRDKVARLEEEIQTLITSVAANSGIREKIRKVKGLIQNNEELSMEQEEKIYNLDMDIGNKLKVIDKLSVRLRQAQNCRHQKLNFLKRTNPDTYEGTMWLQNNRHMFKATVHPPIMLCLNLKDSNFAKYLESHVSKSDLEAFVCEDADDVNKLAEELRTKRNLVSVNILHSEEVLDKAFRKPIPEERLSEFRFLSYLSDMYEAPPAVQSFLCRQKNLHRVPVFQELEAEEANSLTKLMSSFNFTFPYYINNTKIVSRQSRYSQEISTAMTDIGHMRATRLGGHAEEKEAALLEEEIDKEKKILTEKLRPQKRHADENILNMKEKLKDLKATLKELQEGERQARRKEAELETKTHRLKQIKMKPVENMKEEVARIKVELSRNLSALSEEMHKFALLVKKSNEKDLELKLLRLKTHHLKFENRANIQKKKDLETRYASAKKEQAELKEEYMGVAGNLRKTHDEAAQLTGVHPEDKKRPPDCWQAKFDYYGKNQNIETLNIILEDLKRDVSAILTIKPSRVNEIAANTQQLEAATAAAHKLREILGVKVREAEEKQVAWIKSVEQLVGQVNSKFSKLMASMGYVGQVNLTKGKDNLDFNSYGFQILVKFLDNSELMELSRSAQSGGEKSVTTAIYMMALQELSKVPFRCVDEINQGLDEVNERLIWDLLLSICKKYQSQYFYMAPKLPYNLKYSDEVKVLICHSGSARGAGLHTFSAKKFSKLCRPEES